MQKYTELKLRELNDSFDLKMFDEWDEAASSWAGRGFSLPNGQLFKQISDIGMKYLDKLLEELLSAEKAALMKIPSLPAIDDFSILRKEIIQIALRRLELVRSKIDSYQSQNADVNMEGVWQDMYEHYSKIYESRIHSKIDLMQEELRLKIVSHSGTVINVGGDTAVVNTGIVYGSIHGQIGKMKETSSAEVAELFNRLLEAVKDSQTNEEQKLEQMQNVELLVTQYETPPEKRNRGLISASMNFLSMAANLTTLWGQFGPKILEAFKLI